MAAPAQEGTLVGLCDGEIDTKRHHASFLTSKVGGAPDWLPGIAPLSPRCGRCAAPLVQVVQVYCPLDVSPYHRHLHLFACPGSECSSGAESWRVLRSQCLEASRPPPAQEAPLAATDWCDTADDWGMEEEEEDGWGGGGGGVKTESQVQEEAAAPEAEAAGERDVSNRLQDLSLGESAEDVPAPVPAPGPAPGPAPAPVPAPAPAPAPVLQPFFISVVEEADLGGEEDDLRHAQQLLKEYERREGVMVGELEDGEAGGEEKYEKTRARHGDAVFSRFMKSISLCPQQILRYSRGGSPLFISEPPASMAQLVPACGGCGGSRTFELQLMPALVSLLRGTDGAQVQLEFGTVLVYTCRNSCWTAGAGSAVDEFCFLQTDPDQKLFK